MRHPNCRTPYEAKKKKKETYFVTVSYVTYEIDERFRHVDPKFG
jgi:hypothetical protein